jgi:hypothetical protein
MVGGYSMLNWLMKFPRVSRNSGHPGANAAPLRLQFTSFCQVFFPLPGMSASSSRAFVSFAFSSKTTSPWQSRMIRPIWSGEYARASRALIRPSLRRLMVIFRAAPALRYPHYARNQAGDSLRFRREQDFESEN